MITMHEDLVKFPVASSEKSSGRKAEAQIGSYQSAGGLFNDGRKERRARN